MDRAAFAGALGAALETAAGGGGLAVALSHDHYLTVAGGLQNCIAAEQAAFARRGWTVLHLCPLRPLPTLAGAGAGGDADADAGAMLLSLDGVTLGTLPVAAVIAALARLAPPGTRVIVHQMLGHSPEQVATLIAATRARAYHWTHDLFAHCPSVHLLRNDAVFCGGPAMTSAACATCHAGADRPAHRARMDAFFAAVRPTLLAPSATMLAFWRGLHDFPHDGAHVLAPCDLEPGVSPPPLPPGPLRVGFLGGAVFHKGWDVFEALAHRHAADPRYAFVRLGSPGEPVPGIAHVPVCVSPADLSAMARAVAANGIGAVVNWSRCHESFSFTAMEALAGGAFLLARRAAGNVAPLLASIDLARGVVLSAAVELQALFATGRIVTLVRAAPRSVAPLQMGPGAAALLPHAAAV